MEQALRAVPPTKSRLIVKRDGSAITGRVPRPVVLVDTREQLPLTFDDFPNWIAGEKRVALKTGDYSVEGMEDLVAIERKSLNDLVMTLMHTRARFFEACERMTAFKYRAILVEATLEDVKSPYAMNGFVKAHPNGVVGTLDAIEAKFCLPVMYTSQHRVLATEKLASYLSKVYTYEWLEREGLGRVLQPGDL